MYFLIWGFLVWLGATLIFRFLGHFFFNPENALLLLSYLFVVPAIFLNLSAIQT
ncbi:putative tellurium resistance membrane protein TerC [Anoxybacillus tepidamans]|uniref:Putative tellurium resistance membrane protein TerC n=1 Tax=Anoxybacteroides tepidamans TaxID=265948 RepID=A0A7W8IUA9_9BACL|nr:putative tellurium resistance membrane protein TerC [Anoxybacillus tepidamans]